MKEAKETNEPQRPLDEILQLKRRKAEELRARGVEPYPHRFERKHRAVDVLDETKTPLDSQVVVAGRLVQIRNMGKAGFADLQDGAAKLQLYVKKDIVGESAYELYKNDLHVGDFLGVSGRVFKSKTGQTTVEAKTLTLLSKAIRPMPEKWHGLQDSELRNRFRHLDLIANEETRRTFETRGKVVRAVRRALDERGYLEVETPVLLPQAGGAAATPFETHHNALDRKLFMRIATELYLKRCIIGGLERVYEVGRVFRNEGVDTSHNPEFTMLEAYESYSDYHGMAELAEAIFASCCDAIGADSVTYREKPLRLRPPFKRAYMPELWKQATGADIHDVLSGPEFDRPALLALASKLGVEAGKDTPSAKVFDRIFDERIQSKLWEPTFVLDHPTAITPLAKSKPGDPSLVERFELYAAGMELANAYTELNDPEDQKARLAVQMRQKDQEKAETDVLDQDFIEALEHGMPPTGGIGVGIDRLAMLFSGRASIRDVILYPTLRDEAA